MAYIQSTSSEPSNNMNVRRKILSSCVCTILQEIGFLSVDKAVVGTLVEMMESMIKEIGRSSRSYAEVAYRTEPVIADIILALVEMGICLEGLQAYGKRPNRIAVPAPVQQIDSKQYNILQIGDKKTHPQHIPDHLPPFPDTHTYCFSQTYKQPVTEYEAIREKSAIQKRDIERALTKFACKTNETYNLFLTDDKEFLLIAAKPKINPYIDALMPRDQVFEEPDDYGTSRRRKKRKHVEEGNGSEGESKEKERESELQEVENPYLGPIKMPRKPKVVKKQ